MPLVNMRAGQQTRPRINVLFDLGHMQIWSAQTVTGREVGNEISTAVLRQGVTPVSRHKAIRWLNFVACQPGP